jgi:hypothetical protein
MGCSIHQIDRIFEENPDLETVFAHLLHSISYGYINARGWRKDNLTTLKWHICYIKMTTFLRRIQICSGNFVNFLL